MKKVVVSIVLVAVVCLLVSGLAFASTMEIVGDGQENTEFTTKRTVDDYVMALKQLARANKAGDVIIPERNPYKYVFVPLMDKSGKVLGYGTWINLVIYQHPEDFIAVVNADGTLQKWYPLDANEHHPEMKDEDYLSRFYGMTKDRDFITEVDLIAGSTISCNLMFAELKNILLVFDTYIAPQI